MSRPRWLALVVYLVLAWGPVCHHSVTHAGCTSTETTALVLDYMTGDDRWSGCGAAEEVETSLKYWGIREDEGEVYFDQQMYISDGPTLTIITLEEEIPGRRVVFISSHGGDDPEGGCFAAEFYDTRGAMEYNYDCYVDPQRPHPYIDDVEVFIELDYEPLPPPGGQTDTTYLIMLTGTGIKNHLNSDDPEKRVASEAIVHGSWCKSRVTQGKWGETTFVGYDDTIPWDTSCDALRTFWQRLRCEEYPRYEGNTEDAALGTALSVDGTILDNRLDCTRSCWGMNPAARLGSQWAYMESDGVVIGWHVEAELDTREYRVEAGDGLTWELIASVTRGDMAAPQIYSVPVKSGYKYYRVVEIDRDGRRCGFHPLVPAEGPPEFLHDLMETAKAFEAMDLKRQPPTAACGAGGDIILEKGPEDVPDWVFYGPDSLLAECAPAVSWFESEGLAVDMVLALSPDH